MVGGGQIGNVEQEGERDRCVENELSLVSHSSLSLSLPTFSICKMWFEGKTTNEMVLRGEKGYFTVKV